MGGLCTHAHAHPPAKCIHAHLTVNTCEVQTHGPRTCLGPEPRALHTLYAARAPSPREYAAHTQMRTHNADTRTSSAPHVRRDTLPTSGPRPGSLQAKFKGAEALCRPSSESGLARRNILGAAVRGWGRGMLRAGTRA